MPCELVQLPQADTTDRSVSQRSTVLPKSYLQVQVLAVLLLAVLAAPLTPALIALLPCLPQQGREGAKMGK